MAQQDNVIKQDRAVLWFQPDGPGTEWSVLGLGTSNATGKTIPGPTRTAVFGVDVFGQPVVQFTTTEPPGGLPTMTIGFYDDATVSFIDKAQAEGCDIFVQIRVNTCGALNNPNGWDVIDHFSNGLVGDITPGDGPVTPFAGAALERSGVVQFEYVTRLVKTSLSSLTSGEANSLNGLAVLTDAQCGECGNGYPGADKIMYATANAAGAATANVIYSRNSGGSWATTSADPFAADENIGPIVWNWIGSNQFRLVVGCLTTDAGAKAKIATTDVTLGDEGTTVWDVNVSASASGANGETVVAMSWPFFDRLYISTNAGEIYVSTDQGDTWDAAAAYVGTNQINAFAVNHAGSKVWAVGASNTILRETDRSGTFVVRNGPSGGGAFTAIAVMNDGSLVAGNGTSIFKSNNEAENTGGWTLLKSFGANKAVKRILKTGGTRSRGGDSQAYRVVVDDTAGGVGQVWETTDGGATFRQITALTNTGYNDAKASEIDNNLAWIVGDGAGVIHQLAP